MSVAKFLRQRAVDVTVGGSYSLPRWYDCGARFVPQVPHTFLTVADGGTHPCFIIDVSTAGCAVSSEYDPPVGTPLAIGACIGRVLRKFDNGFAVKFVERQNRDDVVRLLVRAASTQSPEPLAQKKAAGSGGS